MAELYRGRLAPSPTGYLHLGHISTFRIAAERAQKADGKLVLRIEDLDRERCKPEYDRAILEDLRAFGFLWHEGPDVGGPFAPYRQSQRFSLYRDAWRQLRNNGHLFPCFRSRKDMQDAPRAPHSNEPVYPPEWRPPPESAFEFDSPTGANWRFRVPLGKKIQFLDGNVGLFSAVAGKDFGDFPVWRKDDTPAYELAVVVDDWTMQITEVVRGEDLLLSTCRQLLLYEALGWQPPRFYHVPLVLDASGKRLSKRDHSARAILQLKPHAEKLQ